MNKTDARKIAETITNKQLSDMFDNAKNGITNWAEVSSVNKIMTKGTSWNILYGSFDVNRNMHVLAKKNMIWEFGDFLPDELKIKKKCREKTAQKATHQEPIF